MDGPCSAIRATLGQRQFRQSPGLALNAHSGNEWDKIPVLTGTPFQSKITTTHYYRPMHSCGCCYVYAFFPLLLLGEGIIGEVKNRNRTDRDTQTDSCCWRSLVGFLTRCY